MQHPVHTAITVVLLATAALVMGGCGLLGGGSSAGLSPVNGEVLVVKPRNLTGRPLRCMDQDIFTAGSLTIAESLYRPNGSGSGAMAHTLDFLALLRMASETVLAERGIKVAAEGGQADNELHLAVTVWSADEVTESGRLWIEAKYFLVDTATGEVRADGETEGWFQLLDLKPGQLVLGAARAITGQYEALAYGLAERLLAG